MTVIIARLFIFFEKMLFNVTFLRSSKNKAPEIITNNGTPIRDKLLKNTPDNKFMRVKRKKRHKICAAMDHDNSTDCNKSCNI